MSVINQWSRSISKFISSGFEVSSSIANHGTILGDAREGFIRDILQRFLPANIIVGSGQIVDQNASLSKQIDIIIYRADFPILRTFGSADVYLIEGVVAVIEVKSHLNRANLFDALDNGKSVRNLLPTILMESLDHYSTIVYENCYNDLNIAQRNSIMGMLLPPAYIFSYRGYTSTSINELKVAINEWHNDLERGELDVTILPEVIVTQGCVAMKNLNNIMSLPYINDSEVAQLLNDFNAKTGQALTLMEMKKLFLGGADQDMEYGYGIKVDESPLQYLISSILESIFSRIGHQQLGGTGIQYNLLGYHISPAMEGGWAGAAANIYNVRDPKLDIFRNLLA